MSTHLHFPVIPSHPWRRDTRRALADLDPRCQGIGIRYEQTRTDTRHRKLSVFSAAVRRGGGLAIDHLLDNPCTRGHDAAYAAMRCNEDDVVTGISIFAFCELPWNPDHTDVIGLFFPDGAVYCRLRRVILSSHSEPVPIQDRIPEDIIGFVAHDISAHGRMSAMAQIGELATFAIGGLTGDARLAPTLRAA